MELKKDTTENVKFAYENEKIPNPNDNLFRNPGINLGGDIGGGGTDEVGDAYTIYGNGGSKKSGIPSWLLIACAVVIVVVIGIFVVKHLGTRSLDGAYIMKSANLNGVEYTVEQLEEASGMTFYMRLEIDGKEGYLTMSYAGMVGDGSVDIDVDGSTIYVSKDDAELIFKYDKSSDTISYEQDGVAIIFERIK